jgi:cytochrome d ubiquinol oxidase subunit II
VIVFLPLVLGYQAWTYYVFRRRVSREEFLPAARPAPGPAATTDATIRLPVGETEGKRP